MLQENLLSACSSPSGIRVHRRGHVRFCPAWIDVLAMQRPKFPPYGSYAEFRVNNGASVPSTGLPQFTDGTRFGHITASDCPKGHVRRDTDIFFFKYRPVPCNNGHSNAACTVVERVAAGDPGPGLVLCSAFLRTCQKHERNGKGAEQQARKTPMPTLGASGPGDLITNQHGDKVDDNQYSNHGQHRLAVVAAVNNDSLTVDSIRIAGVETVCRVRNNLPMRRKTESLTAFHDNWRSN